MFNWVIVMLQFQLFRTKVYPPVQRSIFAREFSPQLVLAETIRQKPASILRKGHTWHIGNLVTLDLFGMYFALGRTTKSTLELYDSISKNFLEREFETAPYTHVICDTSLEVCGIAAKAQLAPSVESIARQLEKLLNSTVDESEGYRFEISVIQDPEEFIQQIREAYSVKRFALTFTLPNPFDVNEDFQRPMERLLRDAHGEGGKTSLTGNDLNADVLEELTRSAAATGNQAEATIKRTESSKPVRRRLRGGVATIAEEELATDEDRRSVLREIRDLYVRIRGSL
jgi:hypothetical protein